MEAIQCLYPNIHNAMEKCNVYLSAQVLCRPFLELRQPDSMYLRRIVC